jgi:hypothetical protein
MRDDCLWARLLQLEGNLTGQALSIRHTGVGMIEEDDFGAEPSGGARSLFALLCGVVGEVLASLASLTKRYVQEQDPGV